MPRSIRFHLDENCANAVAEGLRRRGLNVTTTTEAGLIGATDEEQARYALREGRVLFTQDRDFLRLSASGVAHAGIIYAAKDTKSIGEIIFGIVRVWELSIRRGPSCVGDLPGRRSRNFA